MLWLAGNRRRAAPALDYHRTALDYHRTVFGYHGCDQSVADHMLGGGDFRASENNHDWLGRGIYFREHGAPSAP